MMGFGEMYGSNVALEAIYLLGMLMGMLVTLWGTRR